MPYIASNSSDGGWSTGQRMPKKHRASGARGTGAGKTGAKAWPLRQRPGFLIRRLHQIHVALFQQKCADFEITPLQYSLLSALAKRGTADQTTLAADISFTKSR